MSTTTASERIASQFPLAPGAYVLRGASILGERTADVLIEDGIITQISEEGTALTIGAEAAEVPAQGQILLPGLVDVHVHLREPGMSEAETIETGTQAAAKGGFTGVCAMANSKPVADSASIVEQVFSIAGKQGWAEVRPVGAVTKDLAGEQLSNIGAMAASKAQVRMFSDDGMCVHDAGLMRRALEYVKAFGGFVAQHAQEPKLTAGAQMNEGETSATLGLPGWPAVAEEAIIARDVLLAKHLDSRLHVCHVSTAGSVEVIRWAKEQGVDVTAEVTPHHLLLTDDLVESYNPVFKVNPPLRTQKDVEALRQAVADGIIDVVATDHAPHPDSAKSCEWAYAAMGMTGLETSLSLVIKTLIQPGLITWADAARIMSETPARLGQLAEQGQRIEVGAVANLTLVDPEAEQVVDPSRHASKGNNSPFAGMALPGKVMATFFRGHPTVLNGELNTSLVSAVSSKAPQSSAGRHKAAQGSSEQNSA